MSGDTLIKKLIKPGIMLLSMTGFGSAIATYKSKKFSFEIKSLNSKQLDLTVRIPSGYRKLEADVRNIISSILERGKVEFMMYAETTDETGSVQLNIPVLRAYKKQIEMMARELELDCPDDWYSTLLRFPDAVRNDAPTDPDEEESKIILEGVASAAKSLMDYRAAEGVKLEEFFAKRIANIGKLLDEVPRYETERIQKIHQRISDGLASIPQVDYDKGRLEQEMIFYIEKLDINEEKQRLRQHLDYFMETMRGAQGQGKKLGFIAQEMGREINTLGSKSNHAEMQILVVKMKDELEQIKEQVLNCM